MPATGATPSRGRHSVSVVRADSAGQEGPGLRPAVCDVENGRAAARYAVSFVSPLNSGHR